MREMQSSPLETAWASNPSSSRIPLSDDCTPFSSSTIRIGPRSIETYFDLALNCRQGQINDDSGADRKVGLGVYAAMMVRNNLPHYRQAQSGAPFARRKIRQENAVLVFARKAPA